ncbi:hypothetical protein [Novipirellula rosea]|uniref:GYF domain-containing protein n=1 Tax=Novipirellula rosea TaxID=1031540 RepID=A0ABP8NRD7_9BACT
MVAFYVKTEHSCAGPFTGVELREAALSGIIGPNSLVADTETGPWHPALAIGLFSEKRVALPHPAGTIVPRYHVRGMLGAAQGPFKLRELIGFAARGMLAADAEIQSDVTQTWIPVDRIHVLRACLTGDLVLLGSAGKIQRRTDPASPHFAGNPTLSALPHAAAVAPATVAQSVLHASDAGFHSTERDFADRSFGADTLDAQNLDDAHEAVRICPPNHTHPASEANAADENSNRERFRVRVQVLAGRLAALAQVFPRSRMAMGSLAVLTAIAAVGILQSQYQAAPMPRDRVLGDWIDGSAENLEADPPSFAISFRPDGSCVIFAPHGGSWTGDFSWTDRGSDSHEFSSSQAIEATYDVIAANHLHSPVKPSDGHVRFQGMMSSPPLIAGHKMRDCFLRRDKDSLLLGYLSSVRWAEGQKTLQAGWIRLRPFSPPAAASIAKNLKSIPAEPRPADVVRGSEPDFPIAEAISSIEKAPPAARDRRFVSPQGRLAYSSLVDADYLLRTFGIPDAARPLFPFEAPRLRSGPSFETSQLIRYGDFKFLMNREGHLQYVSRMQ